LVWAALAVLTLDTTVSVGRNHRLNRIAARTAT